MNITIKGTQYALSVENKTFIEKKLGGIARFVREEQALLEVEVEQMPITEKDGTRFRAEANLAVNGKLYRAEARSASFESAVEKVKHELEQEVRRAKGKDRGLMKRGGQKVKELLRMWR